MYLLGKKNKFELVTINDEVTHKISIFQRKKLEEIFGEKDAEKLTRAKCLDYQIDGTIFSVWAEYWEEMEEVDIIVEESNHCEQMALRINRDGELKIYYLTNEERRDYDYTVPVKICFS